MGWVWLQGYIFTFSGEAGDAASLAQMLIYAEKKTRDKKEPTS